MNKLTNFIVWICKKFSRNEIEKIINELTNILSDSNSSIQPKDDFKEKHPNYRNYTIDSELPLTEPKIKKKENITGKNY